MCICMTACELAVGMPRAGSLHDWNKRMLGPRWGMLAAFMEASMNVIFLGSVSLGTGYISNYFFMWTENADISAVIWGMGILAIIFVITMLGGEVTGKAQLGLIIVLCGIMVVFIIAGILSGKTAPENYEPFAPFGGIDGITGGNLTVGFFADGTLLIANKDFAADTEVTIRTAHNLERLDPATDTFVPCEKTIIIPAGHGTYLRIL